MSNIHLSATPADPYQWRESVLSTRSLSYLSTTEAGSSSSNARDRSMSNTARRGPTRQSTEMTDDSDYSLEMAARGDTELNDIAELPESVADSRLFLLPREIRDRVYAQCMTADDNIPVEWPAAMAKYGLQPQLLRTCKLIHDEAAPLLYTLNHMTFHHPSDANMFVRALTSPGLAQYIQFLSLHMKAVDNRLWMPYLTSRDKRRSLEHDFPYLRELSIRFRSNKWLHNLSAEANLKIWADDSRLDEVIDGIRNVYFPGSALKKRRGATTFVSNGVADPIPPLARRHDHFLAEDPDHVARHVPIVKVSCACRITHNHFSALTAPLPSPETSESDHPDLSEANNGTGVIQQTPPTIPLGTPVRYGDAFTGFTPVDLRTAVVKRVHDDDLGSASVASTAYADKDGILLALEIHCVDPKKEGSAAV